MVKNYTPNCTPNSKSGFLGVLGVLVEWEREGRILSKGESRYSVKSDTIL
jgi:hypothetical protein